MSNVTALRVTPEAETESQEGLGFEGLPVVMSPSLLADVLQVTTRTLERWRVDETGPKWFKIPGSSLIRYARVDFIDWIVAARDGSAS
ncbi:MAG TPA: hypothetical protein VN041_07535 [Microbacterium sp.]|nr:hypothetical protein [Microbacterium sp.]